MTISIARLSAQSGLRYLFKTTMMDDLASTPPDATTYYMKAGTPEGRWIGSGLNGINKIDGDVVTELDARAVFDHASHPSTGTPLGRAHSGPIAVGNKNGPPSTRHAVVGFDLTFSVPKSVSVLWALSPRSTQDRILRTHHEAMAATLNWLEENVIHTRAGRNGVAHLGTRGAIAASFDHWESRTGDPQLHTHLVIANRVQRITDGAWVTLDSRTLYQAAVAASEHYNGLLFDALQQQLGTDTDVRVPVTTTHNPSQQLTGIDEELIREFSNRSRLINVETDRLVAGWIKEHGHPPTATTTSSSASRPPWLPAHQRPSSPHHCTDSPNSGELVPPRGDSSPTQSSPTPSTAPGFHRSLPLILPTTGSTPLLPLPGKGSPRSDRPGIAGIFSPRPNGSAHRSAAAHH